MNDQQLNNLVAEAIGLDEWVITKSGYYYRPDACVYTSNLAEAWKVPLETAKKYEMYADNPKVPFCEKVLIQKAPTPDFGRDLNEMHKAEIWLSKQKNGDGGSRMPWYRHNLEILCLKSEAPFHNSIHAKAIHRREAFLKSLKLI